jgi:hypothetical protein
MGEEGPGVRVHTLLDPRSEVPGLVGQRAQRTGSDVEEVSEVSRPVRHASPEIGPRFDDDDPQSFL